MPPELEAVLGSDVVVGVLPVVAVEVTPVLPPAVWAAVAPPAVELVPVFGVVELVVVVGVSPAVGDVPSEELLGVCCDVVVVGPLPLVDEVSLSANELPVCVVAASNSPPIIVPAMRCRFFLVLIYSTYFCFTLMVIPWREEPS